MNRKTCLILTAVVLVFCSATNAINATNSVKVLPTSGTINIDMSQWYDVLTLTPAGACTLNVSGAPTLTTTGQPMLGRFTLIVTTSGTSSFVITFGTNFKAAGTLTTGTTSGKTFAISFVYNGTLWVEDSRTGAM